MAHTRTVDILPLCNSAPMFSDGALLNYSWDMRRGMCSNTCLFGVVHAGQQDSLALALVPAGGRAEENRARLPRVGRARPAAVPGALQVGRRQRVRQHQRALLLRHRAVAEPGRRIRARKLCIERADKLSGLRLHCCAMPEPWCHHPSVPENLEGFHSASALRATLAAAECCQLLAGNGTHHKSAPTLAIISGW